MRVVNLCGDGGGEEEGGQEALGVLQLPVQHICATQRS